MLFLSKNEFVKVIKLKMASTFQMAAINIRKKQNATIPSFFICTEIQDLFQWMKCVSHEKRCIFQLLRCIIPVWRPPLRE